jgi:methylmalonyl-CoA/ethylmalonyl-CoA epimerase
MSSTETRPAAATGLGRIAQIAVNAHDIDRATAFYRDVLGLRLLFQAPPKMSFFDCAGVRLMLGVAEKPEHDHPSSILYFQVDDITAAHAVLAARGVAFEAPPHQVADLGDRVLWLAFFHDGEGNLHALSSEVPK